MGRSGNGRRAFGRPKPTRLRSEQRRQAPMPGSPGRGFFFARRIAAKIAQAAGTTAQGLTLASVPVGDVEV